jgi:ribosomal protein S18 acetylase RimI-like enzyme
MVRQEVVTVAPGPAREAWVPLLELADEPEALASYLHDGELFGLTDGDGRPRAAILVVASGPDEAELRAVAVAAAEQGRGLGTRMIDTVLDVLDSRGVRRVVVGTASSGVRQLAFYQRCGFRLTHVERDFFTPERGYPSGLGENGIPTRDMVWMDREL